jgi:diguanylate cyclase (GGDEF)-like protein
MSATRHVGFELSAWRAARIPTILIGGFFVTVCTTVWTMAITGMPRTTLFGRHDVPIVPIVLLVTSLVSYALLVLSMGFVRHLALAIDEKRRVAEHAASHDPATGLPNRFACRTLLDKRLSLGDPDTVGVLLVNFDRLKDVNDAHDIVAGDQVTDEMIARMRDTIACVPDAVLGRFGGDEFIALLPSTDCNTVCKIVDATIAIARAPITLPSGVVLRPSASSPAARCGLPLHARLARRRTDGARACRRIRRGPERGRLRALQTPAFVSRVTPLRTAKMRPQTSPLKSWR